MKLKKGKVYESLILSDIHFLTKNKISGYKHKELFIFLNTLSKKNIKFKRIILAGDIIENWKFNAAKKIKKNPRKLNKLFEKFDKLALPETMKVFIIGNHDTTSYFMKLSKAIEEYLLHRNWDILDVYKTPDLVIAHGHQGQYGKFMWFLSILLLRMLYFISLLLPGAYKKILSIYYKHLNYDKSSSAKEKLKYYANLSKKLNQNNRLMIVGHAHEMLCFPELKIINTGDWVKSQTVIIQEKNKYIGCRFDQSTKTELDKEFVYAV